MKKCTSCTKDLPEAALHCVFCGAKQPPAPAVPASAMAKTAFGYSANEVMDQLRGPGSPQQGGYQPPRQNPPSQPPPSYQPQPAAASAKTVMVSPGGAPPPQQQTYVPPQQQGYQQGYPQPYPPQGQGYHGGPVQGGMGINAPNPHTPPPLAPMHGTPPYLAGPQARMSARPVEPWRDSLKLVMFVWGAVMLAAFVAPKATDPDLVFQWKGLGDLPAKAMVMTLLYPAIGLLSIVFAAVPLATIVRGAVAAVLALAGVIVPFVMAENFDWQLIVGLAVFFTLIPGLLLRNEYTDSLLARVLVTIGVICILLPYLVPHNGDIKLVQDFKALLDAPGKAKFVPITDVGLILLAVMSLLAWMPAPATGGAKIFAWMIILWLTLVTMLGTMLVMAPEIGKLFKEPAALVEWGTLAALMALSGYGLATVIGKQLE
ncbi:MAG: hypothetical protein ACM31C_24035 [Acidobacteriota bacterium]